MSTAAQPWFIHHIRDLVGDRARMTEVMLPTTSATYRSVWVRAIGDPPPWTRWLRARILAASYVLAGKAVAVQWPRDGELELALYGKPDAPRRELPVDSLQLAAAKLVSDHGLDPKPHLPGILDQRERSLKIVDGTKS